MARFKKMTSESPHQIEKADRDHAVEVLKKRVDNEGMFVVHQDIYLRGPMGSDFDRHCVARCDLGRRRLHPLQR